MYKVRLLLQKSTILSKPLLSGVFIKIHMKYGIKMFYIYLAIIVIKAILNIILIGQVDP